MAVHPHFDPDNLTGAVDAHHFGPVRSCHLLRRSIIAPYGSESGSIGRVLRPSRSLQPCGELATDPDGSHERSHQQEDEQQRLPVLLASFTTSHPWSFPS